ncbi:MAG: hypothetical protein WBL70_09160 [Candidatus Acidiferrales bacterium]
MMRTGQRSFVSPLMMTAALGIVFALARPVPAQDVPAKMGVPDDWTHHHLVFSNPGSAEDAMKNGAYDRWLEIVRDPRYILQQAKREAAAKTALNIKAQYAGEESKLSDAEEGGQVATEGQSDSGEEILPDADQLPRGVTKAPSNVGTSAADFLIAHQGRPNWPSPPSFFQRRLHTDWSEDMGGGATLGLGVTPAKFSFQISSANCASATSPDFVVYNTSLPGATGQASIVAFDNLYSGCTGTVPTVYWAFNTAGGTVVTSVVLSLDGSQVAFVQSNSSGAASLAVLRWKAASGTLSVPTTLTATAAASYHGCPIPCFTAVPFSGSTSDSGSSPYYDYASDTIYVGDDRGNLHKFIGVFNGTPTEVGAPWAAVSASALDSPVYDSGSGNVFVGDYLLNTSSTCAPSGNPCGFLYSIKASSGVKVGTSNELDYIFGIVDGPLVDSSAGMVYVFAGADNSNGPCGTDTPCSAVYQFPTSFTSGSGTKATVGSGYEFMLSGTFDNAYFTSAGPTGHLYVIGSTGAGNNTLYQVAINSNVMSKTTTAGPAVSNNFTNGYYAAGLQATEIYNGTHDYIFTSVLSYGAPTGCGTGSLTIGCVMGFDVTSGTISGSTATTGAAPEAGGTSGITIDNISTFAGASQIYFTPLANQTCTTSGGLGGCAIQTSQAVP